MRKRALIAFAAFAAAGSAPSVASAPVPVAHEAAPTSVAALGNAVVWSRALDHPCGGQHRCLRYALVARVGGRTRRLPIRERAVPFDVDLGRGPSGRLVAAYSRCLREPLLVTENDLPAYATGGGCDLYLYDFAARRERRLALSRRGVSEVLPSVWGNRVAFAARTSRGSLRGYGAQANVVEANLDGSIRAVVHRGYRTARARPGARLAGAGPLGVDLRGKQVAVAWGVNVDRCGSRRGDAFKSLVVTELRVAIGRRAHVIERACSAGGETYFSSPAFVGSRLCYYGESDPVPAGHSPAELRRYSLRSGQSQSVALRPPGRVVGIACAGNNVYVVSRTVFDDPADASRRRDVDISRLSAR